MQQLGARVANNTTLYFPLFQTYYQTNQYPQTKENKSQQMHGLGKTRGNMGNFIEKFLISATKHVFAVIKRAKVNVCDNR